MQFLTNPISKLAFLVLLIFSTGCKNNSEKNTIEETQLSIFGKNYTAAWNSQKPENVASFFSIDGTLSVNNDPPLKGRDAITEFADGFMTAFPNMKLIMDSLISKPDIKEYHWTFIGTNTGPNGTGNKVKFSGMELWKFDKEGLIQSSKGSYDAEEYKHQLEHGIDK